MQRFRCMDAVRSTGGGAGGRYGYAMRRLSNGMRAGMARLSSGPRGGTSKTEFDGCTPSIDSAAVSPLCRRKSTPAQSLAFAGAMSGPGLMACPPCHVLAANSFRAFWVRHGQACTPARTGQTDSLAPPEMYEPNPLFGGVRKALGLGGGASSRVSAASKALADAQMQQFLTGRVPVEPDEASPRSAHWLCTGHVGCGS